VIQLRHRQRSLWHSGLAKDIEDLWEPWMLESVYDALGIRRWSARAHANHEESREGCGWAEEADS
jgi:hypothetical protein